MLSNPNEIDASIETYFKSFEVLCPIIHLPNPDEMLWPYANEDFPHKAKAVFQDGTCDYISYSMQSPSYIYKDLLGHLNPKRVVKLYMSVLPPPMTTAELNQIYKGVFP
jgi:hypothetical protein